METLTLIYLSGMTDAEWAVLEPLVTPTTRRCWPRLHPLRRILNAIFYLVRSGCAWRLLRLLRLAPAAPGVPGNGLPPAGRGGPCLLP